jgi:hypothetical protein
MVQATNKNRDSINVIVDTPTFTILGFNTQIYKKILKTSMGILRIWFKISSLA